jgi:hypothetical protein
VDLASRQWDELLPVVLARAPREINLLG